MSTPTDTKPEETPEPVEKAGPVVPHPEPDEFGWVHIDHVPEKPKDGTIVTPNCGAPCFEVAR
ncbi:hypothetical protein ABZ342_26990 [Amycolatopsis sp. NPDC005961]|uniref:Uncharacterized protein n=1 Tax=Amycolatopsis camponoti TaxID=2606593 RepID=A0A6I8LJX2_9PSEU|nr:hypothetical protein [Amycolatopsis camponoti]VVJ16015.1 Uncharacterised protein [Amycolatopsis camponoti]